MKDQIFKRFLQKTGLKICSWDRHPLYFGILKFWKQLNCIYDYINDHTCQLICADYLAGDTLEKETFTSGGTENVVVTKIPDI